ncbi:MAG TPA: hypothetical protein VJ924_06845 [Alphaproteobacteria bacterium]|nr:hypothetical protein [Alphaproteobacteria bacterium]
MRIKAHVQRSGRITRLKIIDPHAPALPQPNPVLVKAVVRANLWFRRLMADPKQSIPALAKEYGPPSRYARQILRLAFLAPDITEAILNGHQPPSLQLRHLIRRQPLAWPEQRRTFGFPSRNGQAANLLS